MHSLQQRSNFFSLKSLTWLSSIDIAHRLEFVRIMMQRLECNVFMLSYRGCVRLLSLVISNLTRV